MITLSLLICLIGLIVWLVFSKVKTVSDPWVARLGELSFFAGMLAYLLNIGMKTV